MSDNDWARAFVGARELNASGASESDPYDGRIDLFTTPLQGKSELNDREIINIVSEYKIAQASKNFKSSGAEIAKNQETRYAQEKISLLKLVTV